MENSNNTLNEKLMNGAELLNANDDNQRREWIKPEMASIDINNAENLTTNDADAFGYGS